MRFSRTTRKIIVAFVVLTAIGVFSVTAVRALIYVPSEEFYAPDADVAVPKETLPVPDPQPTAGDYPIRFRIPSIGIDTDVEHVGVKANGNMATPKKYADVAWYQYGTVPGFKGSAVFAGHVDNGLRLPGVFKHLDEVNIGDSLFVQNAAGFEREFEVIEIQRYPYKEVPTEVLFNRSDTERLNLVTCAGAWVAAEKTYDQRLVVFAQLKK